jgi:hypothetical protein
MLPFHEIPLWQPLFEGKPQTLTLSVPFGQDPPVERQLGSCHSRTYRFCQVNVKDRLLYNSANSRLVAIAKIIIQSYTAEKPI